MTFTKNLIKPLLYTFFALYFVYSVLSRAPAELAASAAHAAVPNLWLTGVEGTLWSGKASAAQVDLQQALFPLGNVTWVLEPWTLLLLSPCVNVEATRPGLLLTGKVCQSITGSTRLSDVSLETIVDPVNELLPVKISGQTSVSVLKAKFKKTQVQELDARVSWLNGSVYTGESWLAVGSYGANLNDAGKGEISAHVFDVDAPLKVDMAANWQMDRGWKTEGTVSPVPSAPELLKNGIQLVGEELEPGVYKVIWP